MLRQATRAFAADEVAAEDNFRWGWLTTVPSNVLWDDDNWHAINVRQLQGARDAGALARLPIDLTALAHSGRLVRVTWRTLRLRSRRPRRSLRRPRPGSRPSVPCCSPRFRGREAEAAALIESDASTTPPPGVRASACSTPAGSAAILFNGLGRYERGADRGRAGERRVPPELFLSAWALPELIEAASGVAEPTWRRRSRTPGGGHDCRRHRLGAGHRRRGRGRC